MYDAGKIVPGILIFLGLVTFPIWYSKGKALPPPQLKLDTPTIQQLKEKRCVESGPYMTANHMQMLELWRNSVVRDGEGLYVASDGKRYAMSLSKTCMNCHSNKEQFCDRCHNYEGVSPNCWSCHIAPRRKVDGMG
jgi:hypothetical protein